jgi:NADH-quinone oxidoreductase subunit E
MPFSEDVLGRLDADAAQIIGKYPRPRSALLPLLHLVQSEEGFVSADGIEYCAAKFGLTEAEVTSVLSFYTMYKRRPVGEYHVGVCTNTLCAIMGGDQIFAELTEHLGVGNDETTPDGKVILEHIECNAACDYAPVVMVNWEFFDNQTPSSARQLVDDLRAGNPVSPTRGASRLCTWKQASRILAGFGDGQATDGPTAGPASLVGLKIARERGWTAPSPDRDSDDRSGGSSGSSSGNGAPHAGAGGSAGSGPAGSGVSPADSASPVPGKSPEPGQPPEGGQTPKARSSGRSRPAAQKKPPEAGGSSQPEQESP